MEGRQIREAREARGWTQEQLADAMDVGKRTVGNWERGATVPRNRLGMLREVLGEPSSDDPLASASELALLSELMRRAARRAGQ